MFPKRVYNLPVENIVPVLKEDGSNKNAFYCADVIGQRKFAQNYAGYPRSDISIINEQSDLKVAQNIFNDLVEYQSDGFNSSYSDAEIMLSHRSKYQQAASEKIAWYENQLEIARIKQESLKAKEPVGTTIEFKPEDNV